MRIAHDNISPHDLGVSSEFIDLCVQLGVLRSAALRSVRARKSLLLQCGIVSTPAPRSPLWGGLRGRVAASDLKFDMLFGPAYKGIPLVTITAAALAERHARNVPLAFNRKEAKEHGEGAKSWAPRCRAVSDRRRRDHGGDGPFASPLISSRGRATPAGVLLALDRQERASGSDFSAVQEVRSRYQIPVISVVNLADLMHHVSKAGEAGDLSNMRRYRDGMASQTEECP